MWSISAYKASNWKRYPWFYSMLNGLQFAFIFGGLVLLVNEVVSTAKLNSVEKGGYISTTAVLVSFREVHRTKSNKYFPSKLFLKDRKGLELRFAFNPYVESIPNVMDGFKRLKVGGQVEAMYFKVLGRNYLIGININGVSLLEPEQAIQAYRYREGGKGAFGLFDEVVLFLAVVLALIKYKIYGLRNYFKRIDKREKGAVPINLRVPLNPHIDHHRSGE